MIEGIRIEGGSMPIICIKVVFEKTILKEGKMSEAIKVDAEKRYLKVAD